MNKSSACWILLCVSLAACNRMPVAVQAPTVPVDRLQFEQGLAAFEEFTPDGYRRAAEHFQRASELSPDSCEFRMHAAQANLFLALEEKLNREDFRPAWELGAVPHCAPTSAFALRLDALRSLDDFAPGRDRTALSEINEAIALEPSDPLNWLVRWKLNPTTTRQENAILKAAEIAPDLAIVQYELGNYWLVQAEYEKAEQAFMRALDLSPKHFRSLIGLAQALSAIDEDADVEDPYQRAVSLAPGFLEGRILLGDYYASIEENELAREHYRAALEQNPEYEIGWVRLGLNYLQTMELDKAETCFQKAIEVNPSNYEAYYYLGNIAFAHRDLKKAGEQYETSLKFVLNFPEAVYALGTVFFREGKTDAALEQFEKVLRLNRAHADAYFSRAAIRARRHQFNDAIDDYNRAIDLYDRQLASISESIEQYEQRGLTRKVEAQRKAKERLENIMERARQMKIKAEDENYNP